MQSAITNFGRKFIVQNETGGACFSITHFALAWVNETEFTNNPASAEMTTLIQETPGSKTNGDYIFNIWQTPFYFENDNRQYGLGTNLSEGFGSYYSYEFDECKNINTLKCYATPPSYLQEGFRVVSTLEGASATGTGDLTLANIPAPLKYNTITAQNLNVATYSKYFPIKSFHTVETTDDTINALVSVMNYQLELPAVTTKTSDLAYALQNAIGNFKFNRIGLYATLSTYPDPIPGLITSLTPVANEEPVLFACIDLTNTSTCGSEGVTSTLDIYKTRDDKGLASYTYDAQISLSSVNSYPNFAGTASMYVDMVRDEATNSYLNQLETQANTTEAIVQMQLQILQLSQYIESITGINPITPTKKGLQSVTKLGQNFEYFVGNSLKNTYYFTGNSFRSFDTRTINNSNAFINVLSNEQYNVEDGDTVKIIIDFLDGRSYSVNSSKYKLWTGSIHINNYDGNSKTKLLKIDNNMIAGIEYAKVIVTLMFSSDLSTWLVSDLSIFDENNILN